jgi:hypothetical protein
LPCLFVVRLLFAACRRDLNESRTLFLATENRAIDPRVEGRSSM